MSGEVSHDRRLDDSIQALFISRPLVNGVGAPDSDEEIDRAVLKKYIGILRRFSYVRAIYPLLGSR